MTKFSPSSISWRSNLLNVEDVVQETLREILPGEADTIGPDTALKDTSLDSVGLLELKMRLEERLDVELEADVFDSSTTFREITCKIVTSLSRS